MVWIPKEPKYKPKPPKPNNTPTNTPTNAPTDVSEDGNKMTNQEAIEKVRVLKFKYPIKRGSTFDIALDMAIEALKAQDRPITNGIIDVSEALEYCKRAAEVNKKLMMESLKMDKEERNPQKIAWSILANQFFSQQYTEWDIYVPNMIKGLADGTWKEHFEEDDDE